MNLLLLFLGCIMDIISIILVVLPLLAPAVTMLGFNLIWFGIVFTVNMELAVITPPVGLNLYVVKGIVPGSTLGDALIGALPFALVLMVGLALLIFFPGISMTLPNLIM